MNIVFGADKYWCHISGFIPKMTIESASFTSSMFITAFTAFLLND